VCSTHTSRPWQGEGSEGIEIYFDVDFGRLRIVVTQQLADFTERGAMPQQPRSQSMSKLVCSEGRSVDTGALEAMPNDRSNAT